MRRALLVLVLALSACHGNTPTAVRRTAVSNRASTTSGVHTTVPSTSPPTTQALPTPTPAPGSLTIGTADQPSDSWVAWSPLTRPRAGLVAGLVNGDVLAVEGESRPSMELLAPNADGWALDTAYDTQAGASAGLQAGLGEGAGAVSGSYLYVAGGQSSVAVSDNVAVYDSTGYKGDLVQLAMPTLAAAAGVIGQTLYVAGGANTEALAQLQRVDLSSKTVNLGANMPLAVAGAASAALNGKLYVFGGYTLQNGQAVRQTMVQVYDSASNTWRSTTDGQAGAPAALLPARDSAAACAIDGKLYVFGGRGATGALDAVSIYDPSANTWSTGAPMPTARALLAVVAVNGYVLALGGFDADKRAVTTVERYRP